MVRSSISRPTFWHQIYVLQTKNMKTLSRNRRRVLMLILYPIYFVALLSILKQSAKAQKDGFWGSQPHLGIDDSYLSPTVNNATIIAYSCDVDLEMSDCHDVMELFESSSGFTVVNVKNVVSYWREHQKTVLAGIELKAIEIEGSSYIIRLDNDDLKSAIEYGVYGQVSIDNSKPSSTSLAAKAYVNSGFVFLQHKLDCSLSQFLVGSSCADSLAVVPFPVAQFQTYYSSNDSLSSLVPFYMVIAFCNIIVFVVINVVIEKETKMVETLSMHGMSLLVYWSSWLVTIAIVGAVTCAACTVLVHLMNLFPHTNTLLVFIVFFLYNLTLVPLAFVISTFFQNERVAGLVGGMGSIVVGAPAFALTSLSSPILKNTLAILSPLAMAESLAVVMDQELNNQGVTWSNINEERQGFSYLSGILFLLFDILLYLLLAWYLHQVLPNNSGIRKHPLFCFRSQQEVAVMEENVTPQSNKHLIEAVSDEMLSMNEENTVKIRNLSKKYMSDSGTTVHALSELSLEMYQGQIFALLGHNGAGKSTAISMLTGLSSASSGEVTILGKDMSTEMDSIRHHMGYVPQHDTLFLALTVDENLAVFAGLKGVSDTNATQLLERLGLGDERHMVASKLSGGQKRSLSVAIALIGRPKFLVLDEPTAGMDPVSRRRVWDVLLEHKAERITLLTTHFLDEADVLGDRIAILAHGRLECMGSPLFLKTHLGVGYHLNAVPDTALSTFSRPAFIQFIQERIPNCAAAPASTGSDSSDGVHVTIPMAASETTPENNTSSMSRLLVDLDANLSSLGLAAYGISLTTLEEVFVSIAAGYHKGKVVSPDAKLAQTIRVQAFEESRPTPSLYKQFQLVMKSKILVARRAVAFNLAIVLAPAVCVVFSLFLQSLIRTPSTIKQISPLAYSNGFKNTDIWWSGTTQVLPSCLSDLSYAHSLIRQGSTEKILEYNLAQQAKQGDDSEAMYGAVWLDNSTDYESLCAVGVDSTTYGGNWSLHFNQSRVNSLPAYLSLLDGVTLLGKHDGFKVTAALLSDDSRKEISTSDVAIALTLTYLIGLAFAPFGVTFVYEVVKDREEGRQQQFSIMRVHPFANWGSAAVLDFVRWCTPFVLIFAVIAAYQSEMLLSHGALAALILVVIIVGMQTILGSYCVGQFIETTETVSTTLSPVLVLGSMLFYTVVWTGLVGTVGFHDTLAPYAVAIIVVGGILFPPFLVMSAFSIVIHLSSFGLEYPSPASYLGWSNECPYSDHSICFGVMPVVTSASISILLSSVFLSGFGQGMRSMMHKVHTLDDVKDCEDVPQEIQDEKAQILQYRKPGAQCHSPVLTSEISELLLEESQLSDNAVVIMGLRKEFKEAKKVAVEGMYLGIRRGECFGLLGHNGAGKTSLIGMLTGQIIPSSGDAFVGGFSVVSQRDDVLRNTGLCPQFGGTWPTMTLREHLALYAGLRGFEEEEMGNLLDEVEKALAVEEHSDKLVQELSGGNRRKLSAALALIGGPTVVYLDEPSTGVDAATRRHLWEFIAGNQAGRATVLTTHAMEEAEVLASRIGIMVSGHLQALGTAQELKSKYGAEWQLDLKLRRVENQQASTAQDRIIDFMREHFTGAKLEESFSDSMRFLVPASVVTARGLGYTFNLIESQKQSMDVNEFSLSQTTLENVFLRIAQTNEEEQ